MPIVRGASIHVDEGEIVVVLGPNGAGKSSFIKAIAGLVPVTAGTVMLDGDDITRVPAHLMVRRGLAFVPQTENVFPLMSVEDNLRLSAAFCKPPGLPHASTKCTTVPRSRPPAQMAAGSLSGGQRQMLAVARALIVGPQRAGAGRTLRRPVAEVRVDGIRDAGEIRHAGLTIVLVEQNARAALAIGDRAYVLVEGKRGP